MDASRNEIPTLRTERLLLRPMEITDLADFHAVLGDTLVGRTIKRHSNWTLQESQATLKRSLERQATGELMTWAITEDRHRPLLGFVGLVRIDALHQRSEVAYELRSDHWGKGLVTEALNQVVEHAFKVGGLHRLEGQASPDNTKSIRVLERCGFVREGLLRQNYLSDGVFHDSVVYGRLADDRPVAQGSRPP